MKYGDKEHLNRLGQMHLDQFQGELRRRLDKDTVKVVRNQWPQDSCTVEFDGPLTFSMLATVSEVFGTESIDIEGRHGYGAYDTGLKVELTVYL